MTSQYAIVPRAVPPGGFRGWRVGLLLLALTALSCSSAPPPEHPAKTQIRFGVEMARNGLWREALFRFENADMQQPGDPEIINNIAVAHEALGHFDLALEAYQAALERAPGNTDLRRNYSRFTEFYQSFRPPEPEETGEDGSEGGAEG